MSNLQATFPGNKKNRTAKKGPLSEIQGDAKKDTTLSETQKGFKVNNKQLKMVGRAIYSSYDEKCKNTSTAGESCIMISNRTM